MDRMQKLGELLTSARERKGISTKEASNQTKIRESMIIAMESGDYNLFSSDTHLKGFIKAYAKYLGINDEKALAMYRRERRIVEESPELVNKKASSNLSIAGKLGKIFNWRIFSLFIGFILISVIIYFFYVQIQAFYREPRLEIVTPIQNQILENDSFVIEGITDNSSVKVVVDGNQANFINPEGRFKVNARFNQAGSRRFTIIAENQFQKKTEYNLDLTYRPNQVVIEKNKLKLFNKGNTDVLIKYTTDNKLVFDDLLIRPLSSFEIDFDSKVSVKDFDTSKIDVYLNSNSASLSSIQSKQFTIQIENSLPIIKTD